MCADGKAKPGNHVVRLVQVYLESSSLQKGRLAAGKWICDRHQNVKRSSTVI
jgi:hypothetical protein